VFQIEPLVQAL
jgi:hypothetical protein